jgi:hypothetical protein
VQELKPRASGFSDPDQAGVELACGDLVEQQLPGLGLGSSSGGR